MILVVYSYILDFLEIFKISISVIINCSFLYVLNNCVCCCVGLLSFDGLSQLLFTRIFCFIESLACTGMICIKLTTKTIDNNCCEILTLGSANNNNNNNNSLVGLGLL